MSKQLQARISDLFVEDCEILFRNFSGAEAKFNPAGRRNFCLPLDHALAETMAKDGWNVKFLRPPSEDDEPTPYIQVAVRYDGARPPQIFLITSMGKNLVGEDLVSVLDWAEFEKIDLLITPFQWEVNGKSGVKAYLKSAAFTIRENPIEQKYADVQYINAPESAQNAVLEPGRTPLQITDGREDDIIDAELVY